MARQFLPDFLSFEHAVEFLGVTEHELLFYVSQANLTPAIFVDWNVCVAEWITDSEGDIRAFPSFNFDSFLGRFDSRVRPNQVLYLRDAAPVAIDDCIFHLLSTEPNSPVPTDLKTPDSGVTWYTLNTIFQNDPKGGTLVTDCLIYSAQHLKPKLLFRSDHLRRFLSGRQAVDRAAVPSNPNIAESAALIPLPSNPPAPDSDSGKKHLSGTTESLHPRTENTLYRLAYVLCRMADIDLTTNSKSATRVVEFAKTIGVEFKDSTVKEKLKEIQNRYGTGS